MPDIMNIAASSEVVSRVENRGGDAPPTGVVAEFGKGVPLVVSGFGTIDLRNGVGAFILLQAGMCYYGNCK